MKTNKELQAAIDILEKYLQSQCAGFVDMNADEVADSLSIKSYSIYTAWMLLKGIQNDSLSK